MSLFDLDDDGTFDYTLDQLPHSLNLTRLQARRMGWSHYVVDGATNQTGRTADVSDFYVSGYDEDAAGNTENSLAGAINHDMTNGVAIDGGSLAVVGSNAHMYGGTALSNASIEAIGGGTIVGGTVGYSGAIFAGAVTSGKNADRVKGPGTALDPHVGSGGYALVGGGGSDFVIKGYLVNGIGGLMSGGTFNPGSYYAVGNGGTALGGTIGGVQLVGSGGTSLNQLFTGSGATQVANAGGASASTAISGGTVFASGGTLHDAVGRNGGTLKVAGGTYVTFLNAGYQISYGTYQAGKSYDNTVRSGGSELIDRDGTAFYSTVLGGAQGTVLAGGTTVYPAINGGSEIISSAGSIVSGSAYNGGYVSLVSGANGRALSAYNNGTITNSGGSVNGLYISNGGSGTVYAGGQVQGFVVNNGGSAILSNGTATNFVINDGGQATITSGAVISGGATVNAGSSTLVIPSGATGDYLVASNGTVTDLPGGPNPSGMYAAGAGGTALLTQSGMSADIASAGYDPNNGTAKNGTVIVSNGGAVSRGGAQSGGTFLLASGGTANAVGAGAGGTAILASGGTTSNFTPISGGTATVLAGAQVASGASARVAGALGQNGLLSIDSGHQLAETDIDSGGTVRLNSGGTIGYISAGPGGSVALSSGASAPTVMLNGATATIPAVGTGVQTLSAVNGGSGIINSGASINSVFLSSGNATFTSGAFVSQLTIMNGASGVLMSGASVHRVSVGSGGWVSGANISNNNELAVASKGTALDTVITYDSGAGTHANDPYTMVSSGGFVSGATIVGADGSTDTAELGGLLTIDSGATLINTSMGYNARIRINGLKYDSNWTTSVSNGILYVSEGASGGTTWKMALDGNYDSGGFILNDDGQGNTVVIYEKCFLAGSMIRTPRGEKAVERLRKGEHVCVHQDGREEIREITAVIQRRARVDTSRPEDMAGWSVLICKDAFGPGLPNRDLSVTPEHCFLFEGRFVPARMLVNGLSIRYDISQVEYDYYHVKTEPHSVIWANGVLTESWLDTDEQARCEEDGTGALRLAELEQLDWNRHAAAPLEVGQAFVQPLHERFAARAAELGLTAPDTAASHPLEGGMTEDPALRVRLENGDSIQPQRQEGRRYFFSLPSHARQVTLCSRTFRPSEAVGPHLDDRRELGVLVGQVSLWTGGKEIILTRHLTDRKLKGWDAIEAGPHRWTNGEAELLLRDDPATGSVQQLLSIEVEAGGPYRLANARGDRQG